MIQRVQDLPHPPARPVDGHKGTFGRVLIVGGSRGMSGAAGLAGQSALRGGAGLVFLAVPQGILPIVAGFEPSYLTVPLPEDTNGRISIESQEVLKSQVESADVIACGPGLGQSNDLAALVTWLYTSVPKFLVLDADALNLLARTPELLSRQPQDETGNIPRILTPHPGEFSRLVGRPISEVVTQREILAAEFAEEHGVVLVLKGKHTIITDGQRLAVNTTGNSGLATGGSGDVLTGLIAAILGQGLSAFDAAHLAVHLHGLAADLAAHDLSEPGLISSDLPFYLTKAWKELGE
ncbi:MAG: NAD(P)H-hydrate dehydratase [Planctomycetaceae bacterium]|nr:NAD(P)H-hydrate dehydratase [Planctomycetaceae bacterium]